MKHTNRESMQRAIGIIEGASFGASIRVQDALAIAVDLLDDVLNKEEDGSNEQNQTGSN